MNCVHASAPGKMLLTGEYAVLDGAPALVLAVDRRVHVRIESARDGAGRLNAAQLGIRRAEMRIGADRLQCSGVDPATLGLTARLIPSVLRALGRAPEYIASIDIEIDSGALFEAGASPPAKLGLGSSAAVCAALTVALGEWCEGASAPTDPSVRLARWLPIYRAAVSREAYDRNARGARASGADLAACFFGGFSEFRSADEAVHCTPVSWPQDLWWRAIWTGKAAQTTDFVGAFDAWKQSDPDGASRRLARLRDVACRAAAPRDASELFEACEAYAEAMLLLGDAMGMQIMTPAHRKLAEHGRQCGVLYKSCGAGGGDLGIALALDPERLGAFELGVSDHGGVPLNLTLSDSGADICQPRLSGTDQENQ